MVILIYILCATAAAQAAVLALALIRLRRMGAQFDKFLADIGKVESECAALKSTVEDLPAAGLDRLLAEGIQNILNYDGGVSR